MQKIIVEENVDGEWSEKKKKEENGLKTVECLRGRLLAERDASRNAKEEAEQMGNKLKEVEAQLKDEIKARNRAEKKLKYMIKKLESLNTSYVSGEFTCVSSITKEDEEYNQNVSKFSNQNASAADYETSNSASESVLGELTTQRCRSEDSSDKANSSMASNSFEQNQMQINNYNQSRDRAATEDAYSSSNDAHSGKSGALESSGYSLDSKTDKHILNFSIEDKEANGDDDRINDHDIDNAMALVPVAMSKTAQKIDPAVLDTTVKEVLDSLRRAKEKLQISMDQGRAIKVG